MNRLTFDVNNGQTLVLVQERHDGEIRGVAYKGRDYLPENVSGEPFTISPGDMVMLLNYYRYQKSNGQEIF